MQMMITDKPAKDTKGKWIPHLVPWKIVVAIARVREYGSKKYGSADNWKNVESRDYLDAMMRHMIARMRGELIDPESKLPHTWHIACNLSFIIEREEYGHE